ncbi:MAG: V-type ATP synthase subunit E [Candidatus Geothermincolia bacterium]
MPLDELVQRILTDAQEYADNLVNVAKMQRLETLEQAEAEAKEKSEEVLSNARKAAVLEKHQRVTSAVLETRQEVLKEKQRVIQEVMDRAVETVVSLPREEYVDRLLQLLLKTIGDRDMELVLSPADQDRIGTELAALANEALAGSGRPARVALSPETRDMAGGFILVSEDVEIDCSIDAQVEAQREEIEEKLAGILFDEGTWGDALQRET